MSFIPLIRDDKLISTEASLKYFLTQALASISLLFAVILIIIKSFNSISSQLFEIIIFSALLIKRGSSPFHFWFPKVIEGLNWWNAFILITWQKVAPLILISYLINKPLILIRVVLSTIVGGLGGLNQTSLRKLIVYSSINHLGWLLAAIYINNWLWMNYLLFYSLLIASIVFLFYNFKASHINQLFIIFFINKNFKFILFLNLISLGGLPPFLGFFPKLIVIQLLTLNNQITLLIFILIITLITLYFYLRLCYRAFILNYYENNWINYSIYKSSYIKIIIKISFFSQLGLFPIYSLYLFL